MPAQLALFDDDRAPEGLRYQPDFVSAAEERELVDRIRQLPLAPFQFGAFEGHRRVASFGWRYDYTSQSLERAGELPDWILPFNARVETYAALPPGAIRQVLFTEYEAGVGIGWHRDKRQFDVIFGLSLASTCRFRFRRSANGKWDRFTLDARPRSLYMMAGASRQAWEHSIPPVPERRYSATFRTMRQAGS
jgi:alkylated DNA repair dioxygenase AlkB